MEASGPAKDLRQAHELFANAALEISAIIALATNASMGLLEPELTFDVSSDTNEHEFLQSFIHEIPVTVVPGRRIDVEIVAACVKALANHPERKRLQRATVQYVEALRSWRPGHEITCLAHLYMGIEALTKALLREHLRKLGKSEDEIAAEWKVDESDRLKRRKRIDGEVRRRLIFRGDEACFQKARNVSDAFEHGYSDFIEMRKPANEVIVKTAEYLRRAIIELMGVDQPLTERALGAKYDRPRGPLTLVRYIRGTLIGKAEQLAAEGQMYPILEWHTKLKSVRVGQDGLYQFEPDETITAKIGQEVQFCPRSYEVWVMNRQCERDRHPPKISDREDVLSEFGLIRGRSWKLADATRYFRALQLSRWPTSGSGNADVAVR